MEWVILEKMLNLIGHQIQTLWVGNTQHCELFLISLNKFMWIELYYFVLIFLIICVYYDCMTDVNTNWQLCMTVYVVIALKPVEPIFPLALLAVPSQTDGAHW